MRRMDIISGVFWVCLSVLAVIESSKLGLGSWQRPGSGFLPFGAASILGLLSIVNLVSALRSGKEIEGEGWANSKGWPRMVFVLVVLLVYTLVLEKIGFMIGTFALMLLLVKGIEPQSWPRAILFSFLVCIISYLLFQVCLKSQLPVGFPVLGF